MLVLPNKANSRIKRGNFPLFGGFGGSRWSPTSLFKGGEQGWLMDLSLASMFQDAAGTIPVTEPGQPVGLVLDKSQGLVLGPELVTNGDFSAGSTGWVEGTGITISGGAANFNTTTNAFLSQSMAFTPGATYEVSLDVVSYVRGAPFVLLGGSSALSNVTIPSPSVLGTKRFKVVAFTSGTGFQVAGLFGSGWEGSIDNISVRELPGNHAFQSTALNRPIYGLEPKTGRRNLLTYTEDFSNASWLSFSEVMKTLGQSDPEGGANAALYVPTEVSTYHSVRKANYQVFAGQTYRYSIFVKSAGYSKFRLSSSNALTGSYNADIEDGVSVGGGWYRHTAAFVGVSDSAFGAFDFLFRDSDGNVTHAGDGTSGIFVWGAQLELGTVPTPYQKVTTAFDVTEAGVPSVNYLSFNGTNQWMQTAAFDWGSDEVTACVGLRKLSDAAIGVVAELSANAGTNNGAFYLAAPLNTSGSAYSFLSRGVNAVAALTTDVAFAAPHTGVMTGLGDISGDSTILRVDGTQVAQSAGDQGTGNYLSYPLYIGARGGSSLFFNGNIYSLFGVNRLLTPEELSNLEKWTAKKTGVELSA